MKNFMYGMGWKVLEGMQNGKKRFHSMQCPASSQPKFICLLCIRYKSKCFGTKSGMRVTVKYGNFSLFHSEVVMNNSESDLPSVIVIAFSQASASVLNAVSANTASAHQQSPCQVTSASVHQQTPSSSVGIVFSYSQL